MKPLFENNRRSEYNLYDDWVFHYIFSKDSEASKQALIAVLNLILHRDDDPIVDIQIKDPGFYGESKQDKESVLDIKAESNLREIIDIEVENGRLLYFPGRSVFYGSRMVNFALERGEKYDKMKKSIVISIVNGTLFPESGKVHTTFRLKEVDDGIQLSDRLELHFLELGKILPDRPVAKLSPVEKLAAYMKFASDKTKEDYIQSLIESGGEAIKMTEQLFKDLTEDEIAYERRERRIKYEHDHATELAYAHSEGIEQGELKTVIRQVCKKLRKGMSATEIADALEEDPVYIQKICSASAKFAPDYDTETIFQALKTDKNL